VRLVKVEEIPILDPGRSLYNIKAPKVVKLFYFSKLIQSSLFFSISCVLWFISWIP